DVLANILGVVFRVLRLPILDLRLQDRMFDVEKNNALGILRVTLLPRGKHPFADFIGTDRQVGWDTTLNGYGLCWSRPPHGSERERAARSTGSAATRCTWSSNRRGCLFRSEDALRLQRLDQFWAARGGAEFGHAPTRAESLDKPFTPRLVRDR